MLKHRIHSEITLLRQIASSYSNDVSRSSIGIKMPLKGTDRKYQSMFFSQVGCYITDSDREMGLAVYHRANSRSSPRPHASPIIKKLRSKSVAMHTYSISIYLNSVYLRTVSVTFLSTFSQNSRPSCSKYMNITDIFKHSYESSTQVLFIYVKFNRNYPIIYQLCKLQATPPKRLNVTIRN